MAQPGYADPTFRDGLFFPQGDVNKSDGTDLELLNQLRQLYQIARDHKRQRYDSWIRNYRLVNNRLGGTAGQTWMPNPRDSELYPTLSSLVAWMTDQNVTIDFVPATDPNSSIYGFMDALATDLTDILYSTWLAENYDGQIKLGLWDAFQYGSAIWKSVWDASKSDGYGNAVLKRVDPWSFYPDPFASNDEDANFFFEVRRVSANELMRRFPDARKKIQSMVGGVEGLDDKPSIFNDVSTTAKANPGALPGGIPYYGQPRSTSKLYDPLPGYVLYECWIRENDTWTESFAENQDAPEYSFNHSESKWRVVIFCGNTILLDEQAEDLWSSGQHPYRRFAFDDIGEFWGISLVDHLSYPQIYINRLLTALQHNAELTGNPILIEAANSGTSRTSIFNRPGQRIPVQGAGGLQTNSPKWLDPPQMPAQVMDLVKFWIDRIQNTAGFTAINGQTPNQRNSTDTVQSVQEAAFVRIRSALSNLEYTLQGCALQLADLIVDNYTEPRIVSIVGQSGKSTSKVLSAHHFWAPGPDGSAPLKFALQIRAGSSAPTSRQSRTQEAEKLFALGAVDDQYVLEAHQVRKAQEILQRLYEKRQKGLVGTPGQRQRAAK